MEASILAASYMQIKCTAAFSFSGLQQYFSVEPSAFIANEQSSTITW